MSSRKLASVGQRVLAVGMAVLAVGIGLGGDHALAASFAAVATFLWLMAPRGKDA